MAATLHIRDATTKDIPAITEIYRHAVLQTVATMDTEEPTAEKQTASFRRHGGRFPVLVAEEGSDIVGWASLSPWMERGAYTYTSEASVYVALARQGSGIGTLLAESLLERATRLNYHVVIARVVSTNDTSYRLFRRLGFQDVGTIRQVGYKFGRWIDMRVLQLIVPCTPD